MLDVFNNMKIFRYRHLENKVQRSKQILVPCVYGTRSRIVKSIESKTGQHTVPFIAMSTGSISVDDARLHSIHEGIFHQREGSKNVNYDCDYNSPVPINIEYNMTMVAKHHSDIDQMICNFIPHFRPDISIVTPNPQIAGNMVKTSLLWDKSAAYEFPEEIAESDVARIIVTSGFTHRTWLWSGADNRLVDEVSGSFITKVNIDNTILNGVYGTEYGVGTLEHFYDVPNNMTMEDYIDNIKNGHIKADKDRLNWDIGQSISGDLSGNISVITGTVPEHRKMFK